MLEISLFLLGSKVCAEGSVRLTEGSASEGTVQYCHDGVWGWVCRGSWTADTAQVVCRQLGLPDSGEQILL